MGVVIVLLFSLWVPFVDQKEQLETVIGYTDCRLEEFQTQQVPCKTHIRGSRHDQRVLIIVSESSFLMPFCHRESK